MKEKTSPLLLTRDAFREQVLARGAGRCAFCNRDAVDAHHIIERRLWPDGGYYLDNGAGVCANHHLECERTTISVEDVRAACGITKIIVPPHLYPDQPYDKWGNPVLANGSRLIGELFFDESVQKVLRDGGVLPLFSERVKYPRTHHLPWSPGVHSDDRLLESTMPFEGRRVVVTVKMDGENTSMYSRHIHARSVAGRHHPSRDWVKQYWSQFAHEIPEGWRICGENLYAKHSIAYNDLPSYFLGFSVWNDRNECLPWDETLEWFQLMDIQPVETIFDGIFDEDRIRALMQNLPWETCEGAVLRDAGKIAYSEFRHRVGKYVRANHVQTIKHWMHGQRIEPNTLAPRQEQR